MTQSHAWAEQQDHAPLPRSPLSWSEIQANIERIASRPPEDMEIVAVCEEGFTYTFNRPIFIPASDAEEVAVLLDGQRFRQDYAAPRGYTWRRERVKSRRGLRVVRAHSPEESGPK